MKKDRKKRRCKTGRFFASAAVLGLLAAELTFTVPVQAVGKGSLTVLLEEFEKPSVTEGVSIVIGKVGDADIYGEPEFYEKYQIDSYPINSKETEAAVNRLLAAGALKEETYDTVTDAEGIARFAGLEDGIYLGAAKNASRYGEISPFLIQIPYYGEENGQQTGPSYDVTVHPKALPIKSITPTDTPRPTRKPEISETPAPDRPHRPEVPEDGSYDKEKTPKTGDESPIGILLGLMCVSAAIIGIIRSRREKV